MNEMSDRERIIGALCCVYLVLCLCNRVLVTFIPFFVLPFVVASFFSSLLFVGSADENDSSIDYKDIAIRLFIAGSVAVFALSIFGERTYDKKGNAIRSGGSQGLHDTYNSWTKPLVMALEFNRPEHYEDSDYDGVTVLKMLALALVFGGPLMSYAISGWYFPAQRRREERKVDEIQENENDNLSRENRRLGNVMFGYKEDLAKKDIEIQALRAENRNLKKKLGD